MARVAIRKVPSELPNASLYLDDLEEIEQVVSSICLELGYSVRFSYEIGEEYRFDSLDDLQGHGGKASNLRVSIECENSNSYRSGPSTLISFFRSGPPYFDVPYELRARAWELHGRLEQIFAARSSRLKGFIRALPGWSFGLISIAIWLPLVRGSVRVSQHGPAETAWTLLFITGVLALGVTGYGLFAPNYVHFAVRRESGQSKRKFLGEQAEKAFWAIVGSALTLLSQYLWSRMKH